VQVQVEMGTETEVGVGIPLARQEEDEGRRDSHSERDFPLVRGGLAGQVGEIGKV